MIEILVVVALVSFIILGLLAMFDQTKRAFTAGMTQVDVLESGRSALEILSRDISQMYPALRQQRSDVLRGKAYIKGNWKILRLDKPFGTDTWQL